ncbi:MAG: hypothetical protein QOI14_1571, partial [Actinomycetota bacterium]|nr:hypothetical protein [Actinomycetota bacterium]
ADVRLLQRAKDVQSRSAVDLGEREIDERAKAGGRLDERQSNVHDSSEISVGCSAFDVTSSAAW